GANIGTPGQYFISVTAHGVSMAYVMTTFFIMGFGYFVAVTALARPLPGKAWGWLGFWMGFIGVFMALIPILMGEASVLYTFYPPLTGSPWFYIGLVLVVGGSWVWCVLMLVAMRAWKRENPGRPVPLAMFGTVANALLWLWTTVGVAAGLLFQVIPAALGVVPTLGSWLPRTLLSWSMQASHGRCSRGRCMPSSISGSSRLTSPFTPSCPARRVGASTAIRWAASPSFCSCSTACPSECITC